MKMFNKVLAVILSVIMLLTAIPVMAFASGTSGNSSGSSSSAESLPVTLTIPDPAGTGADGTITIRLNAADVVAALKSEKSLDTLIGLFKDMVEVSNTDIVTVNDLLELVPVDAIMAALLGENNENASALIAQIGGFEALLEMVDERKLILSANKTELVTFLLELDELGDAIYPEEVLNHIAINFADALGFLKPGILQEKMKELGYQELLALVGNSTENLKKILYYDLLLEDLARDPEPGETKPTIDFDEAVDFDELEKNETVKAELLAAIKADYKALLTDAGIAKVQSLVMANVGDGLVTKDSFKSGMLFELAKAVKSPTDSWLNYVSAQTLLTDARVEGMVREKLEDVDFSGMTVDEVKSYLKNPEAYAGEDITLDMIKESVKEQWVADLIADPNSGLIEIVSDYLTEPVLNQFKTRYLTAMTNLVKAEAEVYVKNGTATKYIKHDVVDSIVNSTIAGLNSSDFTDADYNQSKLASKLLEIAEKNDIDLFGFLKDGYNIFDIAGMTALVLKHVNWDNVSDPEIINQAELLKTVLGENGKVSSLMTPEKFREFVASLELDPVFAKIESGELAIETIVNLDLLMKTLPAEKYGILLNMFDRNVLIAELKPHMQTLAKTVTKEQIKAVILPVVTSLLQNVDLISINGFDVAKENKVGDNAGLIGVDTDAIVGLLASLVPNREWIAKLRDDGTLLSMNFYAEYFNVDGEARTKDINLEVVLEGDLTPVFKLVERVSQYIEQYIDINKVGNQLYVNVKMPAVVTRAYAKFLNSDKGASLKNEILGLPTQTGADLVEEIENLTLDQILALFAKVDVEQVYSYILNISQVELVLEKIKSVTGLDYSIETLQDLNAVLDAIATGTPTFEAVANAISARAKVDVMGILEKVASTADNNTTIQKYLDKLSGLPYFGKFIDNNSFSEILDNYKSVDPIDAVSSFISKKVKVDIKDVLATYDANELYQKALEKAADYEFYYNKVKSVALNLLDPNYQPDSKILQIVKKLIPDAAVQKLMGFCVADLYKGDGKFAASQPEITLDFDAAADKVLNLISSKVNLPDTAVSLVKRLVPDNPVTFGLHVSVTFQELSKVTYLDKNDAPLAVYFLPNGMPIDRFMTAPQVEGDVFLHWIDVATGSVVTVVNGDMTVKAIYEVEPGHEHEFSTEWSSDDTYHWHDAICGHDEIADKAEHTWDDGVAGEGVTVYTCTVCRYQKTVENEPDHEHEFSDKWSSDETHHWHDAICGCDEVADKAEHIWDDGVAGNGVTVYTCTVCLYEKTVKDEVPEIPEIYTVTFYDCNGKLLGSFEVEEGKFVEAIPALDSAASYGLYNGKYHVQWYTEGGAQISAAQILATPVAGDTSYTFYYELDANNAFFSMVGGGDFIVHCDGNGNWTVHAAGHNEFHFTINPNNGDLRNAKTLKVLSDTVEMALDEAMIAQIVAKADNGDETYQIVEISSKFGKDTDSVYKTDKFTLATKNLYLFDLTVGSNKVTDLFAGKFEIKLIANSVLASGSEAQRTSIYVLDGNGGAERLEAVSVAQGTALVFYAPHFSEFLLINEYKVSSKFEGSLINGASNMDGEWIPEGAKIETVYQILNSADAYGHVIKTITYTDENGDPHSIAKLGDGIAAMPACPLELVFTTAQLTFNTYYVLGTNIYTADQLTPAILAAYKTPVGYTWAEQGGTKLWSGSNAGNTQSDVYLTPKLVPVDYTVKFMNASGAAAYTLTFNVLDYVSEFYIPAVPEKAGHSGAWQLTSTNAFALIESMFAAGQTEMTVSPVYTAKSYTVFFPSEEKSVAFGSDVTVAITAKPGYTVQKIDCINMNTGATIELTNGKFQMPDANVKIVVTETPNVLNYKLVDGNGNKTDYTAAFGAYAKFTIQVPKNSVLEIAPAIGKLVSFKINTDGSKTLVYAFLVTEEFANNTEISYKVSVKVPAAVKFANALVTSEDAPATALKNLVFAGFATSAETTFESTAYSFATYNTVKSGTGLLWLWILLAVIVLIALIAILYMLYSKGKLKPNFILSFIAWIVGLFFNLCLGIASIVLWITQGTTKKEEVDYHAYGMKNPDELLDEEAEADEEAEEENETSPEALAAAVAAAAETEAITEEVAEEATEEVAEEATEEVAEEATEEVAEEATEEVAEEATEEVAEEATEEVAEEATEEAAEEADKKDETAE